MAKQKTWAGPINWSKATYGMVDLCGLKNRQALDRQLNNGAEVKVTIEITLEKSGSGTWDGVSREYYGSAVVKKAMFGIAKTAPTPEAK